MILRKKIFHLIIVLTSIRLLIAGFTEFGNDEVYYYTYVARLTNNKVIGVGNLTNLHNFAWLNKTRTNLKKGEDALSIVSGNYTVNIAQTYKGAFAGAIKLHTFTVLRNGKTARFFTLFFLKNY